jgi:hypothetical protein
MAGLADQLEIKSDPLRCDESIARSQRALALAAPTISRRNTKFKPGHRRNIP